MNSDVIEWRIEELEHERLRLSKEIEKIETRRVEIRGGIAEMWKWLDTVKGAEGYGNTTFDGKAKVLKLPVFGTPAAIKEAIETRDTAIDGEDEELVKEIRTVKARERSQRAIDIMDGKSPFIESEEDDDGRLPD